MQTNGRRATQRVSAIIDTGSPYIIADKSYVDRIYGMVPGSRSMGGGMYSVPCNAIPTISLTIGGTAFPIDPNNFNQGPVAASPGQCIGGIVAAPQSRQPLKYWSVGDVFLRNVYSVFDFGQNRVGFATPM